MKATLCPENLLAVPFSTTGSSKQREGLPGPQRSLLVAGPLMDLPYPNQRR